MSGYNKVILIGNVTWNVETRCTQNGLVTLENTLAVNERRKGSDGEWVKDVTFVPFAMYGKLAETAGRYLSKGSSIMIDGKIKVRQWEKDGQKQSKTFVVAETMQFLGDVNRSDESKPNQDVNHDQGVNRTRSEKSVDDIPF